MTEKLLDSIKAQIPKINFSTDVYNPPTMDKPFVKLPSIDPVPPELSKDRIDYEDSVLKDFAEEIKVVQLETNRQLSQLIEENRKSDMINRRIIIATLIVAALTLVVTAVGIFY